MIHHRRREKPLCGMTGITRLRGLYVISWHARGNNIVVAHITFPWQSLKYPADMTLPTFQQAVLASKRKAGG
jgi:hypothetical protein